MISLFYDDNNKVSLIYYADLPKELAKEQHLDVEKLEDPEEKEGKIAVLMANEKKYWYEYEDKPVDEASDDRIKALGDSQNNTDDLLQELILSMYQ